MKRADLALLMLGLSEGRPYSPVQIQKALFLVTRNLPDLVDDGPGYDFQPYDYGPFDKAVYEDLRVGQADELVAIEEASYGRWNEYRATDYGIEKARALQLQVNKDQLEFLKELSAWVRRLSFPQLVSAIYKDYPEMRENSIFVD